MTIGVTTTGERLRWVARPAVTLMGTRVPKRCHVSTFRRPTGIRLARVSPRGDNLVPMGTVPPIEFHRIRENLSPRGDILPATEGQARPLTKLEPEDQAEAWTRAQEETGKVQPSAFTNSSCWPPVALQPAASMRMR